MLGVFVISMVGYNIFYDLLFISILGWELVVNKNNAGIGMVRQRVACEPGSQACQEARVTPTFPPHHLSNEPL